MRRRSPQSSEEKIAIALPIQARKTQAIPAVGYDAPASLTLRYRRRSDEFTTRLEIARLQSSD
ncbi:hypothetical protein [Nostoc sp.]|uniref:hypothetical protein n=1 Tax=Nostoc sp. TaxID=1180 RepID=UPI002FF26B0D